MADEPIQAIEVFYSYAPQDERLRISLEKHLAILKWQGKITDYHNSMITAGTEWKEKVNAYLNTARIVLLLVSADFLSSEYCYSFEMKRALGRHRIGETRVIPVLLRPVSWHNAPFSELQVLPSNGKPVTEWSNRDAAFLDIVNGIQKVIEELIVTSETLPQTVDQLPSSSSQIGLAEIDETRFNIYEEQRTKARELLNSNHPNKALNILATINFEELPIRLRWQFFALRGHCYFQMRHFLSAQRDLLFADAMLPPIIPEYHKLDVLILRLHLAAASRELGQYKAAYDQFQSTVAMVNITTPLRYIAEINWGTSLVLYEQAYKALNDVGIGNWQNQEAKEAFQLLMGQSLTYAEKAGTLYTTINELSRSALMNCQIALIEQAMENLNAARVRLKKVLDEWFPTLGETEQSASVLIAEKVNHYSVKERANIASAAACYLAGIEFDAKQYDTALECIDIALKAGEASYIVRRADAYMTKGQILAAGNNPEAITAFKQALLELEHTDRLGAKIRIHRMLGAYLIKQGDDKAGNAELDKALHLANVPSTYTAANMDSSS